MNLIEEWEQIYGKKFVEKIGVSPGDSVIDFGCNIGRYSTVLAQMVGDHGVVYAIDSDKKPLDQLEKQIKNTELENRIKLIHSDKIPKEIEEESIDIVLLYDILHYLNQEERILLYQDIHDCLKSATGILSIHPKHTKDDDFPYWNFKDMTIKDVVMEVESFGEFLYEKRVCDILWHRNSIISSCVYNFVKRTE
jgi:cyclopropane fatty-acyl-phospholipid synthase-like methyltransferase